MDNTDSPLLLLSLNLSDSEPDEASGPSASTSTADNNHPDHQQQNQPTRAERTALSDEDFRALKQSYRPKLENGNIHATIQLPLSSAEPLLPKPEAQELLHAVEELYFFRRYREAAAFVRDVLRDGEARVDEETKRLLRYYEGRCSARLGELDGQPVG